MATFPRSDPSKEEGVCGNRRLARVQARLSQALTALANVCRLNVPIVINQVNVGAEVNGAVRVSDD
jgi:hypothetical protein